MHFLKSYVEKGFNYIVTLKTEILIQLLRYFFEQPAKGLSSLKKSDVLALVKHHMTIIELNGLI
jgi:hypothetical protein